MRTLRKDTWLYSWFDNSLFRWLPLAGAPRTDCGFFWSFLWNGLVYLWLTIEVLVFPLVYLGVLTSLGGKLLNELFGIEFLLNIGHALEYTMGTVLDATVGRGEDVNMLIALPVCLLFMVFPFALSGISTLLLFVVLPIVIALFCVIKFMEWAGSIQIPLPSGDRVQSVADGMDDLFTVIGTRVGGIRDKLCTPIQWEDAEGK